VEILRFQWDLESKYHKIEAKNGHPRPARLFDIDDLEWQRYLKESVGRITDELGEANNSLKNKPWKATHMLTDEQHYWEEIIDGFHFYLRHLLLPFQDTHTPEEIASWIWQMYTQKGQVNRFRQRSGY